MEDRIGDEIGRSLIVRHCSECEHRTVQEREQVGASSIGIGAYSQEESTCLVYGESVSSWVRGER